MNVYKKGDKDKRPWGIWEVIDASDNYVVKKIVVNKGEILSLQSHKYRSENWLIANGEALVTLEDKKFIKNVGDHVFIPVGVKHRIQNNGNTPLVFIELQTGEKLDELDIIRYEDKYNR